MAMGYKRARKRYLLKFEDPELEGFEVTMASLDIGEFTELTSSLGSVKGMEMTQVSVATSAASVTTMLERFASKIISWNLEDEDGTPVSPTLEGVRTQELGFVMQIIVAWMDAMAGVDPTLLASANGGGTPPEALLPMEPLSLSPQN